VLLYLDTSSMVKLFIEEQHSRKVHEWVDAVDVVLTCRVAYAEAVSAFSRRRREGALALAEYRRVMRAFDGQWESFGQLDFDEREAGRLAAKYPLRGFDAIHLSAAKMLLSAGRRASIAFSSFDTRLNSAAEKERLTVLHP
jgi:predicted nucleic acid-binding protein